MIKTSKSSSELQHLANNHYELLDSNKFGISKKIAVVLANKKIPSFERNLFNEINKNLKKIIVSKPSDLIEYEKSIGKLYNIFISKKTHGLRGKHRTSAIKKANQQIFNIFDYNEFIRKDDGKCAYNFTEDLDVNVCLYCNRQYTFTLFTSEGKCRPTIDHFLDKGKHPYFALSFFNLIPSCYTCNSSLKNQHKFTYENNLHPFSESMLDVLNFGIDIKAIDFINGDKKDFNITLIPSKECLDKKLIEKAEKNAAIFKIKELYQGHKDYASEIIKRVYYYDESKINELFEIKTPNGNKLFESRVETIEFALGNFITDKKLGKRTLAKFTRDIVLDLDINKKIFIK